MTLNPRITIRKARMMLRSQNVSLSVRGGRIVTYVHYGEWKQPNTEEQVEARNIMAEATRLAARDMRDTRPGGKREYWEKRKRRTKDRKGQPYKTAYGCAKAYYYAKLKATSMIADETTWIEKAVEGKDGKVRWEKVAMIEKTGRTMSEGEKMGKIKEGKGEVEREEGEVKLRIGEKETSNGDSERERRGKQRERGERRGERRRERREERWGIWYGRDSIKIRMRYETELTKIREWGWRGHKIRDRERIGGDREIVLE